MNNNNNTYLYSTLFTLCSNAFLKKNTVISLLNTHRSYTEKMKVFNSFLNIVMEPALWIFRGSSFHNLAAEVPKRRFPNRMDLFLYGTSGVNAVDRKDILGMYMLSMSQRYSGAQPFNDLKVKSSILN